MSSKIEILFPIDEHAEPRSRSYEGEHVKKSGNKRLILSHTKLFRIKSNTNHLYTVSILFPNHINL